MNGSDLNITVTVAIVTLIVNVVFRVFDRGWGHSGRLGTIEALLSSMQAELKKLADVLVDFADMRGDLKVYDERLASQEKRLTAAEGDIRELRHGQGFIQGPRGLDREYP